jgi:hypothetical protein
MAATALVWFSLPDDDTMRLRGGEGAADIDLRVVALADSGPKRLRTGQVYATGQKLVFRIGVSPASTVWVWATGPAGRSELGAYDSEPAARDLEEDGGLMSLTLDEPGTWTVYASTAGYGDCPSHSCESRAIDVAEAAE